MRKSDKKNSWKKFWKISFAFLLLVVFYFGYKTSGIIKAPKVVEDNSKSFVNDVTQLNKIQVENVFVPKTNEEVAETIKSNIGKISIGGARKSMGGQIGTQDGVLIDMREFNKILNFSTTTKEITVQAGARWYDIQKYIDPYGLSVMIMQSYNNFSVGGSMSTNVHGRYIGYGPLIESVKSFHLVTADGKLLNVSRTENSDLFFAVIGGYGAFGVITDATLYLADNTNLERKIERIKVEDYNKYFDENIRNNKNVIFQNADIYVNNYTDANSVVWSVSTKTPTESESFIPKVDAYKLNRFSWYAMSEWLWGNQLRQYVLDPYLNKAKSVHSRNYEASYDVSELEPASRADTTYVLQEYFIPTKRFNDFLPEMKRVFQTNDVNVLNISIRHAKKDEGSLLAWAREGEVFAFVIYYKQGTGVEDKLQVAKWTREMIDEINKVGGAYYLPYQEHATYEQFTKAYPNYEKFFLLKQKYDPEYRFTNTLWDKYYQEYLDKKNKLNFSISVENSKKIAEEYPFYISRGQDQTYLTLPEWYMVYSYNELAQHLVEGNSQQSFKYLNAIKTFWKYYGVSKGQTKDAKFNFEYFATIATIGVSYSVEYGIKFVYENTIGRITGIINGHDTSEDKYIAASWEKFAKSVYVNPWYEYDYWTDLKGIWTQNSFWKYSFIRSTERKISFTVSYSIKAVYAKIIKWAARSNFEVPENKTLSVVSNFHPEDLSPEIAGKVDVKKSLFAKGAIVLLETGRYQEFTSTAIELAKKDVEFLQIMGNDKIMLSYVSNRLSESFEYFEGAEIISKEKLSSGNGEQRIVLNVNVKKLSKVIKILLSQSIIPEHIYDY
jgi:FAD/FMN-containing dehydrogenase